MSILLALQGGGTLLVLQDALSSSSVDNATLTQHQILVAQAAGSDSVADNIVIVQHQVLIVDNSSSLSISNNIDLIQHHALQVQDCTSLTSLDNITLSIPSSGVLLSIQDSTSLSSLSNINLVIKVTKGGTWTYEEPEKKSPIVEEAELILRQNEELLIMARAFMEVVS